MEMNGEYKGFAVMKSGKGNKGGMPKYKGRIADDEVVNHIDAVRKKISRGRIFSDSAALIREMREERDKELDRAIRGSKK